jgi:hypothetical protein
MRDNAYNAPLLKLVDELAQWQRLVMGELQKKINIVVPQSDDLSIP